MQLRDENFSFHDKNLVTSNKDKFPVMMKEDSRKFEQLRLPPNHTNTKGVARGGGQGGPEHPRIWQIS